MRDIDIGREYLENVTGKFLIEGTPESFGECKNGHINSTYFVTCKDGDRQVKYVLQHINTSIFPDYQGLMDNILKVTGFLRRKYQEEGFADYERRTLNVIFAKDGKPYFKNSDGTVWRVYDYISGATSYQTVENAAMFRKVGAAFGQFQRDLSDFDAATLVEPIKDFHNTAQRFENFRQSLEKNASGRSENAEKEIKFVLERAELCRYIVDRIKSGIIPLRVTHNDTKLNNIMIDDKTGEGICIIDLDTVMPGSALYDFGDSIRFGASSAAEDETELSKVFMCDEMFEAYTDGFLSTVGEYLTDDELENLPMGAIIITLETGIRFLTDYIDGDIYFRTEYPEHNLDRARNQFKLVSDMESKRGAMDAIVKKCRARRA